MPTVTLPTVFQSGQPLDAAAVGLAIKGPDGSANSVGGTMSGFLDIHNIDGNISREEIGVGHVTQSKMVAKTVNCDYFIDLFPNNDLRVSWVASESSISTRQRRDKLAQGIPGAGLTYYLPRPAKYMVFFWHVSTFAAKEDGASTGQTTLPDALKGQATIVAALTPFADGRPLYALERSIGGVVYPFEKPGKKPGSSAPTALDPLQSFIGHAPATRWWSGHWIYHGNMGNGPPWDEGSLFNLPTGNARKFTDVGWHNFGIRVSSKFGVDVNAGDDPEDKDFPVRIRTCRISYIAIF